MVELPRSTSEVKHARLKHVVGTRGSIRHCSGRRSRIRHFEMDGGAAIEPADQQDDGQRKDSENQENLNAARQRYCR